MYQYVGLLELVCSSCPMPTAEVLQDVSVIYARLGECFGEGGEGGTLDRVGPIGAQSWTNRNGLSHVF